LEFIQIKAAIISAMIPETIFFVAIISDLEALHWLSSNTTALINLQLNVIQNNGREK